MTTTKDLYDHKVMECIQGVVKSMSSNNIEEQEMALKWLIGAASNNELKVDDVVQLLNENGISVTPDLHNYISKQYKERQSILEGLKKSKKILL